MSICKMRGENHKPLLHKGLGSVNHIELLRVNNKKKNPIETGKKLERNSSEKKRDKLPKHRQAKTECEYLLGSSNTEGTII